MRKVLFILDNLEGGGAERVFVNIANGFVENNIKVDFLLGHKRGIYLGILDPSITIMEVGGTSLLDYCRAFPFIFKTNGYSHIFTASHYVAAAAIITKKRTRIQSLIYQTHHYAHPPSRELKYLKGDLILKSLYFFTAPFADKIIAVSKGSLEWLRKFSHRKLAKAISIYNPVFDNSIYELAREEVSFPVDITGKTILLNVGRLAEQKDQLTLIKAFQLYKTENNNALLFIVGTGPLQTELENYIVAQQLNGFVYLLGFQQNPYKWIANCDVFILSSKYEGFGNVIVEAMALGKTVVSTDCPSGPAEIIHNEKLGYLCAVQDPAQMAKAIEKAVASPLDKDLLIKESQQYTVDAIVKKYLEIL